MRSLLRLILCAIPVVNPMVALAIDSFSTYERAEFYHNHAWQQWQVACDGLNMYSFNGNEAVIEIGCRGGRVAANVAGRVPHGIVVATEMRGPGAIAFASKNYPQKLYPNLTFFEGDFLQSPYKNSFDLAISFSALHWYHDQRPILRKIYQALKPQGQILFTIPAKHRPEMAAFLNELLQMEQWKPYFANYVHPRRKFTPDEYRVLLKEAGFTPFTAQLREGHYSFENKLALINWFRAFSPMLDVLPEDKRDEFLTDFANLYPKYFPMSVDGHLPFVQDELFIQAIK